MFLPIPIRFHDGRDFHSVPTANGLIIVLNVLVFWMGWHPYVGPGTSVFTVITYAFGHADVLHLIGNMIALLVFGTPVNRRIGNGWYLLVYLGTALFIGLFVRLFVGGNLLGASGSIFAVIAIAVILMPSATIEVAYFALFPFTLLMGLIQAPPHWVFWLIRWDRFSIRAWWGLVLVPLLEFWGLFSNGLNWTNLGHLFGLACGVAAVLMMPMQITMNRRWSTA
jgi:membrane associated rhomboid family serine protease